MEAPDTHWKQTVLWLDPSYRLPIDNESKIMGMIKYTRLQVNPRSYKISLAWSLLKSPMTTIDCHSFTYNQIFLLST